MREPAAELGVEAGDPADEPSRRRLVVQLRTDLPHHLLVPDRVEPDVRITARRTREQVYRAAAALLHGRFETGHEAAAEIEDDRGLVDIANVPRGELEVVRLGAGRRQVPHVDRGARDLLSGVGDRVERCHDRGAVTATA